MKKISFFLLAFFLIASCSIRNTTITNDNKDDVLEKVTYSEAITGNDLSLLMDAFMESSFHKRDIDGKTVGQLIDEQKQFNARAGNSEKGLAERVSEELLKSPVVPPDLSASLQVVPLKKIYRKASVFDGDFDDSIVTIFELQNKGAIDIANLKGLALFKDSSGQVLAEQIIGGFARPITIKAGQKECIYKVIKYNGNDRKDVAFKNTDLNDLNFEWRAFSIQYTNH